MDTVLVPFNSIKKGQWDYKNQSVTFTTAKGSTFGFSIWGETDMESSLEDRRGQLSGQGACLASTRTQNSH